MHGFRVFCLLNRLFNRRSETSFSMQTIKLTDGGILLCDEAFLPTDIADQYFLKLRDQCAWEQKPGIFGHMQPRLIASYGEPGIVYRYSGRDNVALPWTQTLLKIKERIEAVQGEYNYCLLNLYRNGQDSMGMHADDEPEMGNVIGSLSLGATRTFRIKHINPISIFHRQPSDIFSDPQQPVALREAFKQANGSSPLPL